MLISLATMNFKLCYLLREELTKGGFSIEQILPGERPSKGSILVVTTEEEEKKKPTNYPKKVVLTRTDILRIKQAASKIVLAIEGKKIWESVIIGIDPGITIGVALITDGCLRSTLETREMQEVVNFVITTLQSTPSKMSIVRVGSTGGYRRILLLNKLLDSLPENVKLEVVNELQTTPVSYQEAQSELEKSTRAGIKIPGGGKNATAAMEIAFRLGENVKCPEDLEFSKGELKEIQVLSRQYSGGEVTITKELARQVACGLITIADAISIQKKVKKK